MSAFTRICVSVCMHLVTWTMKVFFIIRDKECIKNFQINFLDTFGRSKLGYLYFMYISSVSSGKGKAKIIDQWIQSFY